jgi:phosphoribosylanthranilate isomerase
VENIVKIAEHCGLYGVQLHGEYGADFDRAKKLKRLIISKAISLKVIWKSISIGKGLGDYTKNLEEIEPYVDGILFDTYKKSEKGGTGEVFNWDYVKNLDLDKQLILAGGLSPENIIEAIRQVHPDIVDVNSSLEVNLIKTNERVEVLFNRLKEVSHEGQE